MSYPFKQMWMGPRGREVWVPQPSQSSGRFGPVGWSDTQQLLNGGAYVRHSRYTHQEYEMAWGLKPRDAVRPILDMYHGMLGDGPIYFIDPMVADKNVLPIDWSWPGMAQYGLRPIAAGATLMFKDRPANALGYPTVAAQFELSGQAEPIYIPVPPGHKAWVGVHGTLDSGAGGVAVTPILRGGIGIVDVPEFLSRDDTTRFNASYSDSQMQGIELALRAPSHAVMTLDGIMVQILPEYETPTSGGFISGGGHGGCKFAEAPNVTPYSRPLDLVGVTATLIETRNG